VSYSRRTESTVTLLWKPQNSHRKILFCN
jgi:hypothetical protein